MLIKFIKEFGYNVENCKLHDTDISCNKLVNLFNDYIIKKYNINCVFDREEQTINIFRIDLGFVIQEYNYKKIKFVFNSYKYINKFLNYIITHIKQTNKNDPIILIPLVLLIIDKDNIRKAHTIMLIYRKNKNSFEYYDSNGICDNTYIYNRTNSFICDIINEMNINEMNINEMNINININEIKNKYIFKSIKTSYYVAFNRIENKYGDHKGFCTSWSMFFGELVLLNPYMKTSDLMRNLYSWFNKHNSMNSLFLRNLIINYFYNIQKNEVPSPGTNYPRQEQTTLARKTKS